MLTSSESVTFFTQALPVILILAYFLVPKAFRQVSFHALGKMIAVLLIVLYTYQDRVHGLLVCLLVILYYHRCYEESFVSRPTAEYAAYIPKPSAKSLPTQFDPHLEQDFTHVGEAYPDKLAPIKKVGEALFRKEKCHNAKVRYKNQTMKNNMVTHVYPELQFRDGECNPCDRTCHFTIQNKQETEATLAPKNAHTTVLEDIQELFGFGKTEPMVVHNNTVVSQYQ